MDSANTTDLNAVIQRAKQNDNSQLKSFIMIELPIDTILAMDILVSEHSELTRDNLITACLQFFVNK